ncbi:fusicoccadiene synthase [Xylaria bambusicola]|uniref:fusicoccadiene synthase n=1 Tax=Xylaria bambusicola TaxID=326684 RepID=UPI0020076C03|nr:fusicoccadiene synthase [Xylaria bambusicola]KAI0517898.1 fusicoccadiene synthase [Xylaria bambusicola]
MEYQYSHVIDPRSYDNLGLCDGIPLRVHRNADLEEAGTIRLRDDWRKYVGPLPGTNGGNIGPVYSFTSVTIPECLPDRLEVVSYVMELGFLHDDLTDTSKVDELAQIEGSPLCSGEGRIIQDVVEELIAIDPFRAKELVKDALNYWKRSLGSRQHRIHFANFEDYLEYRVTDCGSLFLYGLATFGMCLTIPAEEKDECFRLSRPVWAAAALTNDETILTEDIIVVGSQDTNNMVNSVWVLMKQHSVDVDTAKGMILEKVRYFVAEYVDTVKNVHDMDKLSLDSKRFIETMQYMISGNLLWSVSTPRYHPDCTLTDLQISRMKHNWLIDHNRAHKARNGANSCRPL